MDDKTHNVEAKPVKKALTAQPTAKSKVPRFGFWKA
eukprot:CAMPEP_0172152948 /NCGR_PEP_ID=MMETSP1050-20130122/1145_1 /TAXON_ID=233186 /ORGANISM="Cryptomonas curvata, Strain CCAP979/52" /LENGTH=35 /DNA_ID= /DNA_START= /DNA_END= /DNA_ORIENTATION=